MKNYIILLPQVYEKVLEYYYQSNNSNIQFTDYLKSSFNPGDRGLLISKLEENSTKIKVWSKDFSLICTEADEDQSLKAVAVKDTKPFQYHFILERGHILKGHWEFSSTDEAKYYAEQNRNCSRNKSQEISETQLIIQDIENIPESDEQFREFKRYQEYWEKLDIVRQQQEKILKTDKYKRLVDYYDCKADFDKGVLVFKLANNDSYFSNGERIKGCDHKSFNQNYEVGSYDLEKVSSFSFGVVVNFDKDNSLLFIEPYHNGLIAEFSKRKELHKGKIWVDDTGTKSILTKQKHALKKLFRKETANPRLKDFVPEIGYLRPSNQKSVEYSKLSNKFDEMTANQKEAVDGSLNCDDIFLIQGPPGTGKTTVICEIIQYLSNTGNKVLLSSQTNLAVDNVLQRIGDKQGIKAIRIGSEEKFELDSEQYALDRRVDNLQQNIIEKIRKNRGEIIDIQNQVANLEEVYIAHQKISDMLKGIVNTLDNHRERLKEKELLQGKHVSELENLQRAKEYIDEFFQKHENDISSLQVLCNIQNRSKNSLRENILACRVMTRLELDESDKVDIENYVMILDEVAATIENIKQIQIDGLQVEQGKKAALQSLAAVKNQIENIKAQSSSVTDGARIHLHQIIDEKISQYSDIALQVKEFDFELNGLLNKKDNMLNIVQQLKQQALAIKQKIDNYIEINSDLWIEVYGEVRITKENFIKLFRAQETFKEEFAEAKNIVDLIVHLEAYQKYCIDRSNYNQYVESVQSIRDAINNVDKYLGKFNEKIEEYKNDKFVKCYLSYYEKTLEDIRVAKDLHIIKSFIDTYMQKVRRIEVHKASEDIQREWEQKLNYYQESFENAYINVSNLICATCLGIAASQNNYFLDKEFDYVIIDEAARSSSLELLIPMTRGRKIVLVGDHKQLSPQIEREVLKEIEKDNLISEEQINEYYKKSLFGLMYDNADNKLKTFLNEQFRMNRDISYVVSHNFYDRNLIDARVVMNRNHNMGQYLKNAFYWVDTPETEEYKEVTGGTSYFNPGEAQCIKELLDWLNSKLSVNKSVGVISPYSLQKNYLIECFKDTQYAHLDLEINTIDAFQGREKNLIIMSLVRNNDEGIMGHTANDSRINVAISRAQELLIIVGNQKFVEVNKRKSGKMYKILQHLDKKGCILHRSFFAN